MRWPDGSAEGGGRREENEVDSAHSSAEMEDDGGDAAVCVCVSALWHEARVRCWTWHLACARVCVHVCDVCVRGVDNNRKISRCEFILWPLDKEAKRKEKEGRGGGRAGPRIRSAA